METSTKENSTMKICPFNMKPCLKVKCVFFDIDCDKCQFSKQADYIVDYLVEVRDEIEKDVGSLQDHIDGIGEMVSRIEDSL